MYSSVSHASTVSFASYFLPRSLGSSPSTTCKEMSKAEKEKRTAKRSAAAEAVSCRLNDCYSFRNYYVLRASWDRFGHGMRWAVSVLFLVRTRKVEGVAGTLCCFLLRLTRSMKSGQRVTDCRIHSRSIILSSIVQHRCDSRLIRRILLKGTSWEHCAGLNIQHYVYYITPTYWVSLLSLYCAVYHECQGMRIIVC